LAPSQQLNPGLPEYIALLAGLYKITRFFFMYNLFIYLFIRGLFNDAMSDSVTLAPNGRMSDKQWIENAFEGSG
jgi:uncharacterized membrane protein